MTLRDVVVLGGCLLVEPTSLQAFWRLARCLGRALERRRLIMRRRTASDRDLARWFSFQPVAQPLGAAAPVEFSQEIVSPSPAPVA
jgi:hypothetical protein